LRGRRISFSQSQLGKRRPQAFKKSKPIRRGGILLGRESERRKKVWGKLGGDGGFRTIRGKKGEKFMLGEKTAGGDGDVSCGHKP